MINKMVKYYKHNKIIKVLTIIGSFAGFIFCLYEISQTTQMNSWSEFIGFNSFLRNLLGMIIAALTLLVAFKPDDPLPWHWLLLLPLGILITFLSYIMGGLLVIIGSVIALIDDI